MNAEVIKAINKAEKKHTFRKWWNTFCEWWDENGYKVIRVLLFPLWLCMLIGEKISDWLDSRATWNEEKANEILNYYIPRVAKWDSENKCFYFFDNGYGWKMLFAKKYIKMKDRRFWKVNSAWVGGKIRDYLIEKFELDGFTKKVGDCYVGDTEITFTLIEKN